MRSRPVLILSLPRSGSSWVGEILGTARNAAYLREPLNQTYVQNEGRGRPSVFEIAADAAPPPSYLRACAKVTAGIPDFQEDIAPYRSQWNLRSRPRRTLILKEVNPLAIDFLLKTFRPYVVYLVRHPVPVAHSYFVQGWPGDRLAEGTLAQLGLRQSPGADPFWFNLGVLHAYANHRVLAALNGYADWRLVRYEDLCRNPLNEFEGLFRFCGLQFDADSREKLANSIRPTATYRPGEYSLQRHSQAMPDLWRSLVDAAQRDEVRRGFLMMPPTVYTADSDW